MQTESRSPGQSQTAEVCVRKGWVASPKALFVAEGVQGIKMGRSGENKHCAFSEQNVYFQFLFIFLVLSIYLYKYIYVCV